MGSSVGLKHFIAQETIITTAIIETIIIIAIASFIVLITRVGFRDRAIIAIANLGFTEAITAKVVGSVSTKTELASLLMTSSRSSLDLFMVAPEGSPVSN